jgi:transposase InsO family protein
VIYRLVKQLKKAYPVKTVCRVLEVSRSGFYENQPDRQSNLALEACVKASFSVSGRCYGSRRLSVALREHGYHFGRYKVRRLMRKYGLRASWKRKFVHTTDSKHELSVAENLLNRQFDPATPNQAWTSDITYIRTGSGWLYLAVVMDLFSRKIVGWAMASHMQTSLVSNALQMALQQRKPPRGLLLHSDRGSQYASDDYQKLLKAHGIVCSMSRKGNCWDNAPMERFFLNLKMERVWQRTYANHSEAIRDITGYIVGFYNTCRLHSKLNYLPPVVYEQEMAAKQPILVSEIT